MCVYKKKIVLFIILQLYKINDQVGKEYRIMYDEMVNSFTSKKLIR